MYIFISHSSNDANIANGLVNAIEKYGDRCFIAPRDIRTGYEYAAEIAEGIDRSDMLILLLSNAANESPHVLREIERAVNKRIPVLVYKLEDVSLTKSMEYFLMTHQWLNAQMNDFSDIIQSISQFKKNKVEARLDAEIGSPEVMTKKRSTTNLIIVIGIFIVCIAFIIACIFIAMKAQQDDSETIDRTRPNQTIGEADETTESKAPKKEAELGDTIFLGSYNGQPIEWKVINISENKRTAVLISKYVLSFKGYDAPDKGSYGNEENADTDYEIQAYALGNSNWETSTIREWLNSDDEYVEYSGYAPSAKAFADGKNAYDLESGFLYNFSKEEMDALVEVPITTNGNALAEGSTITTNDKVFLLSFSELEWLVNAGMPQLAEPTPQAIKKNETFFYRDYCTDYHYTATFWWLREPVPDSSSCCYLVDYGKYDGELIPWEVGVESFGIRPAITVDLTADCIVIE